MTGRKLELAIYITACDANIENRNKLLGILKHQVDTTGFVADVFIDYNQQLTTGARRQLLLEQYDAEYVVWIDDDDMVPIDFIKTILKATENSPDLIGIKGLRINENIQDWEKIIFKEQRIYHRDGGGTIQTYNQWCPRKREVALKTKWQNMSMAEDIIYSICNLNHIYTVTNLDYYGYIYNKKENSEAEKVEKKMKGMQNYFLEFLAVCGLKTPRFYMSDKHIADAWTEFKLMPASDDNIKAMINKWTPIFAEDNLLFHDYRDTYENIG